MTAFQREDLVRALPYARRFARALRGGQSPGDDLVTQSVRALLSSGTPQGGGPGGAVPGRSPGRMVPMRWRTAPWARSRPSSASCCC